MKQYIIILFFVVFILAGCKSPAPVVETKYEPQDIDTQLDNLTNQMIQSLAREDKSKIAIMEFPDLHGNISELGKFIPEELTTRLFMTRRFEVVERTLLNKVLEEHNLAMSGLVDASSAAQIGKMLGVDAIVTGTITDMGTMYRINARIIATETAAVFAVSSVSIEKQDHLVAMMERFAETPGQETSTAEIKAEEEKPGDVITKDKVEIAISEKPTISKTVIAGFRFEVASAKLTNDNRVIIDVLITGLVRDKEIWIDNYTKFYDDLGGGYIEPLRIIGDKRRRPGAIPLMHLFVTNVPVNLTLEFSSVNPDAKSINSLHLVLHSHEDVVLKNIPLERDF